MHLLPSTIHCLHSELVLPYCSQSSSTAPLKSSPSPSLPEDVSNLPKMQVFCKDSCYYALDANVLQMYQSLEERGLCDSVKVDLVPKKKIPSSLWNMATCPTPGIADDEVLDDEDEHAGYAYDSDEQQSDDSQQENYETDSDDALMECPVCHVHLPSITHLTQHQLTKRHFACSTCAMVFSTLAAVQEHEDAVGHCSTMNDND